MKKTIVFVIGILTCITLLAQESSGYSLKNKKGHEIIPQTGDISFGVNAEPFLNYVGNLFDQTGTNSLNLTLPQNSTIFSFKYAASPTTFYRAGLRLNFSHVADKEFITDFNNENEQVEDKWSNNATNIVLTAGIEKRKGKNRLYGFYGAEAYLSFAKEKDKYEYGNSASDAQWQTLNFSTSFGSNLNYAQDMRMLEYKYGTEFGIGAGLFFGAEYFFLPKISVAGEFSWNVMFNTVGKGTMEYEYYNNFSGDVDYETLKSAGGNSFIFDNAPIGILSINLYF